MRTWLPIALLLTSCGKSAIEDTAPLGVGHDRHGPIAADIFGAMGDPLPTATGPQLESFARGHDVAIRRFDRSEGLGPGFNVTFCAACHEKPVIGGSAGLYRNFFLGGTELSDGAFIPLGEPIHGYDVGGVVRMYAYEDEVGARPPVMHSVAANSKTVIGQRNPIPFFGVGLMAAIDENEIVSRADPDDRDYNGVSGRINIDRGFAGRFGRKSQTVSIEGFIRGPLFNHLGITTDPLPDDQRADLPVDSSDTARMAPSRWLEIALDPWAQAAAPDGPLTDQDDAPDPEMSSNELFDLVSFAMLLAAPEFEPLNAQGERGIEVFDELACGECHTPRLSSPRGPIPLYSDLLLHDMGDELADGLVAKEATGSEFRTQPLWGIASTAPYLHDGRAFTLHEAILWHGGEGYRHAKAYESASVEDQAALQEFLMSLGGRAQFTPGLLPLDAEIPAAGEYGGPYRALSDAESARFYDGRMLFDTEFGVIDGVGGPRLNGDSCRACHFDPVIGGSGPRGVNVMRHGLLTASGEFVIPAAGTILHKTTTLTDNANEPQAEANIFEHRQTPHLFGLGLIEAIDAELIAANADANDQITPDGITGRVSYVDGGVLSRFGWKAQVPSIDEFIRDAVSAELGMTLPYEAGMTFGEIQDNDDVADPEFTLDNAALLADYLRILAPPPRQVPEDAAAAAQGEQLFQTVGCALCHTPSFPSELGPVNLYSDLLLHEILPPDAVGIEDASANMWEFRTSPLWGISKTAPYLHSGAADTLHDAIVGHDGEAVDVRNTYLDLPAGEQDALVQFLETL